MEQSQKKKLNKKILLIVAPIILLLAIIGSFISPSDKANRYPVSIQFAGISPNILHAACMDDIANSGKNAVDVKSYGDTIIMFGWKSFSNGKDMQSMKMKLTLGDIPNGAKLIVSSDWDDTTAKIVNEGWCQTIGSRLVKKTDIAPAPAPLPPPLPH